MAPFTAAITTTSSLYSLIAQVAHQTGFLISSATRATAHFLRTSLSPRRIALSRRNLFMTLASLGFQSDMVLEFTLVLPGGGRKKGGQTERVGRRGCTEGCWAPVSGDSGDGEAEEDDEGTEGKKDCCKVGFKEPFRQVRSLFDIASTCFQLTKF